VKKAKHTFPLTAEEKQVIRTRLERGGGVRETYGAHGGDMASLTLRVERGLVTHRCAWYFKHRGKGPPRGLDTQNLKQDSAEADDAKTALPCGKEDHRRLSALIKRSAGHSKRPRLAERKVRVEERSAARPRGNPGRKTGGTVGS